MAASAAEKTRFRRKLQGSVSSMPDTYIDDVFNEAEEGYPTATYSRDIQVAYAYILGIRDLRMAAASDTDYKANDSEEKRSQVNSPLEKLEKSYQAELDELISIQQLPPVMFGRGRNVPRHITLLPDGQWSDDAGL